MRFRITTFVEGGKGERRHSVSRRETDGAEIIPIMEKLGIEIIPKLTVEIRLIQQDGRPSVHSRRDAF